MGENQVGVWGEYASEGLCKGPVAWEAGTASGARGHCSEAAEPREGLGDRERSSSCGLCYAQKLEQTGCASVWMWDVESGIAD